MKKTDDKMLRKYFFIFETLIITPLVPKLSLGTRRVAKGDPARLADKGGDSK